MKLTLVFVLILLHFSPIRTKAEVLIDSSSNVADVDKHPPAVIYNNSEEVDIIRDIPSEVSNASKNDTLIRVQFPPCRKLHEQLNKNLQYSIEQCDAALKDCKQRKVFLKIDLSNKKTCVRETSTALDVLMSCFTVSVLTVITYFVCSKNYSYPLGAFVWLAIQSVLIYVTIKMGFYLLSVC